MSTVKQYRLDDDVSVYYRSRTELEILRREFFDEDFYHEGYVRVRPGDCIFDVGSNLGFFVLQLNRRLPNATVFCFEPIPETFELLEMNVAENNRLDVRLFNCGLSDQTGTAEFTHQPLVGVASSMCFDDSPEAKRNNRWYVYEEMRSRSRTMRALTAVTPSWLWLPLAELIRRWYDRRVTVPCTLRTVSEIIDEHDVSMIDLLKIDVEGAEDAVLAGIREEHWPRIRQAVVETHRGPSQAKEIACDLRDRGFHVDIERCMERCDHLHMLYARRPEC